MNKREGVSALIWSSADKFLTNGFALIVSIILARLTDPSEYGILATASIFTVLIQLFVEPGMTSGLIQKKDIDYLDFSTILSFNLVLALLLYCVLFFFSDLISVWFELPALKNIIRVLGLQIVVGSINAVQIAYVQKNLMFKRYFICSFSAVVVSSMVGIIMAYKGMGVWALVVYQLLRQIINVIMTYFLFHCYFGLRFSKERFCEMFPFSGKILFTKFIDQGYVEMSQLIISKWYSSTQLAYYNKGKSFPDLMTNSLNLALTNVMFPYFSGMQDEYEKLNNSIRYSVKMTSFVCIPAMVGLIACADNFISVLLTDQWINSVPYLRLVCIYNIWIPFSNIIRQSLKAIRKGGTVLKLELIKVFFNVILLVILLLLINSPIAIALSIVCSYTISFFIECYVASKQLHYGIKDIIADFVPSFFISCIMGVFVFGVGFFNISASTKLVLQVTVGVLGYATLAMLLRLPQCYEIIGKIKGIISRKRKA